MPKALTTEERIKRFFKSFCRVCNGRGNYLVEKPLYKSSSGKEHYCLEYLTCSMCKGSGLKSGWQQEMRR